MAREETGARSQTLANRLKPPTLVPINSGWYFSQARAYWDASCFSHVPLSLDKADQSTATGKSSVGALFLDESIFFSRRNRARNKANFCTLPYSPNSSASARAVTAEATCWKS